MVDETLQSGFLSEGRRASEFESLLELELGLRNPVTVNSGTSALHLALVVAGVKAGDEVILPAQTFVASALAVMYCNATPVFADINPDDGNIDPKDVDRKITERTRVVMPVHWGGYSIDWDALNEVVQDTYLVVDDAAHALGAHYKRKVIGSGLADFTCFSTQSIKSLTTGDGGIVCPFRSRDKIELMRKRWFGIDRNAHRANELGERQYDLTEIGWKYHLSDLNASVGIGNLDGFADRLVRRRQIAKRYFDELDGVAGVRLMKYAPDCESAYWLYPLRVENRLEFVRALKAKGIPTSVVHQRIDANTLFGGIREDLVGQAIFDAEQIHIPIHSDLTDDDVSLVISTIKDGWM